MCLTLELPAERTDNVQIGASVAINGTCLTVVAQQGATLRFDVMVETLRRTNLGALQPGTQINFERSARVGDEIGGHTVSGHVHTTATIVDVQGHREQPAGGVRGGRGGGRGRRGWGRRGWPPCLSTVLLCRSLPWRRAAGPLSSRDGVPGPAPPSPHRCLTLPS